MPADPTRVAVLGAGGVGGYYGGALARAGHSVSFLARGAHLEAIRKNGLEVRTPEGPFHVKVAASDDAAALGSPELVIVAVKTYSLDSILPAARLMGGHGATLLPLLNGVDAAERLEKGGVPREHLLGGLTSISVARVAPGVVERKSAFQSITLGELGGGASSRAGRVADVLRSAGADVKVSTEITADLWRKLAFIASMAAACGLARTPVGPVREAPYGRLLFERAIGEVLAVARARGVAVAADDTEKILRFVEGLGPPLKPSLLVDLEAGARTEIDDLCGAVSRFGREAGIPTPIHDTATAAISASTRSSIAPQDAPR